MWIIKTKLDLVSRGKEEFNIVNRIVKMEFRVFNGCAARCETARSGQAEIAQRWGVTRDKNYVQRFVYRRFTDAEVGEKAGCNEPVGNIVIIYAALDV